MSRASAEEIAANWQRSSVILAKRWGEALRRVAELKRELSDLRRLDGIVERQEAREAIAAAEHSRAEAWAKLAVSERQRAAQGRRITEQRRRIEELEAALAASKK